mgnify:CR=1 FL=1
MHLTFLVVCFHQFSLDFHGLHTADGQLRTTVGQVQSHRSARAEMLNSIFFSRTRHGQQRLKSVFRHGGRFVATSAARQG